jgi:hypothetical protein
MKIISFCVKCQKDLEHDFQLDRNSELVMTCRCGCFLKLPATSPEEIKKLLEEHKKQNIGRIFVNPEAEAQQAAQREQYLASLANSGLVVSK